MIISTVAYLAIVVLVWISTGIGAVLAQIAREELKPGKSILQWTQLAAFLVLLVMPIFFIKSWLYVGLSIAIVILTLLVREFSMFHFSFLGVWVFAASSNTNFLLMFSAVLFIYGLCEGTRYYEKRTVQLTRRYQQNVVAYKKSFLTFLKYWLFPVLACIPALLVALL